MRYALAFIPPATSRLWQIGCQWLGRDALEGRDIATQRFARLDDNRLKELTRRPRSCGFSAIIKPPFRLVTRVSEEQFIAELSNFAVEQVPFPLNALRIVLQDDSFCLQPAKPSFFLQALITSCLRQFAEMVSPPGPSEMAGWRADILTVAEKENLARWGYPYIYEQFRFYFSLTSRIFKRKEQEAVYSILTTLFSPVLDTTVLLDSFCLLKESHRGGNMHCIHRFPFPATSNEPATRHDVQTRKKDLSPRHQCHSA